MSLIAAVPGALLAFLLVMAFLRHADKMGGTLNAVVGVALLCGVAAALMPVGILLFGGPRTAGKPKSIKAAKTKGEPEAAAATEDAEELEESSELVATTDESDDLVMTADEPSSGEVEATSDEWDETDEGFSDEFEFDDQLSDDELDFDFDDESKK